MLTGLGKIVIGLEVCTCNIISNTQILVKKNNFSEKQFFQAFKV